jgi:hypothetical protein
MGKYKICNCIFDLNFISKDFFNERFHQYEYAGNKPAKYIIHFKLTSKIATQNGEKLLTTKNGIRYKINDTQYEDLYKNNEVVTRITNNNNQYLIELKTDLTDLKSSEYSLSTLLFTEIMRKEKIAVMHASAISYNNQAILFSAPSGTGKSTQAELWINNIENSIYINDDKPALSIDNEKIIVWGNPWSGKTLNNNNLKVPLKAIVYLEQAKNNEVLQLNDFDKVKYTMMNLGISSKIEDNEFIIEFCNELISRTEIYLFKCNMSNNAPKELVNAIFIKSSKKRKRLLKSFKHDTMKCK